MSTPLGENKSIAQKLHENLTWMRENGASVEEQHAEIARAKAAIERLNAQDQADATKSPVAQKVAEAVISGVPGLSRAVATDRETLSRLGIGSETADEARAQQKENVASLPAKVRIPSQLVGAALPAIAAAPLGVIGGGAAFGAAQGAEEDASSPAEFATNVAKDAAIGAAGAKGLQMLGSGLGYVANRTGLADAVTPYVAKISRKLGASIGARGQVNEALSTRKDLLDAAGSGDATAGKLTTDRIAATKAKANELYGIAKQNTQGIDDPRLAELLNDPQVKQAMDAVSGIREASGAPLPRTEAPATVPAALSKMGTSQETYDRLMALAKQRGGMNTGVQFLAPELKGQQAAGVEVPDPDALAKLKRYLYDAAAGRQDSPLNIKQDEARALMPKVDQIRTILHESSPAWKEADLFYADAKGQEEAFAKGFDAFRKSSAPSGEGLAENSVEAMQKELSAPRYAGEPPAAMQNRVQAFREGVKAAMSSGVRGAPVDRGLRSALNATPLAADEETQAVRGLAFDNPQAKSAFEQLLATKRGEAMGMRGHPPISEHDLAYRGRRILAGVRSMLDTPDRIATPVGQRLVAERLGDPAKLAEEIALWKQGSKSQSDLARQAAIALATQVRRVK